MNPEIRHDVITQVMVRAGKQWALVKKRNITFASDEDEAKLRTAFLTGMLLMHEMMDHLLSEMEDLKPSEVRAALVQMIEESNKDIPAGVLPQCGRPALRRLTDDQRITIAMAGKG